ncbi:hypothetical protein DdX_21914 [Ditylenchus destructor]|uniref:Uncharacterized protein n=1 Tax=Ditylenchus destructor TaxID=166010 RepID=A0AAD4QV93_9BILA|nr:hypothetical protein DdX_21914 [Ditylenchus destructor]
MLYKSISVKAYTVKDLTVQYQTRDKDGKVEHVRLAKQTFSYIQKPSNTYLWHGHFLYDAIHEEGALATHHISDDVQIYFDSKDVAHFPNNEGGLLTRYRSLVKDGATVTLMDDHIGGWCIEIEVDCRFKEKEIKRKLIVGTGATFGQLGRDINDAFPAHKVAEYTRYREQKAMNLVFHGENGDVVIANPKTKLYEMGVKRGAKFTVVPNNEVIHRFLNSNLPVSPNAVAVPKENTGTRNAINTLTSKMLHDSCQHFVARRGKYIPIPNICVALQVQFEENTYQVSVTKVETTQYSSTFENVIEAIKMLFKIDLKDSSNTYKIMKKTGTALELFWTKDSGNQHPNISEGIHLVVISEKGVPKSTNTETSYKNALCGRTDAEVKRNCVKIKVQLQDDSRDFLLHKKANETDVLEELIQAVNTIFGVNLQTYDNADAKSVVEKRGDTLLPVYGHTRYRMTQDFTGKFTNDMHLMIFNKMPFWFWMDVKDW